MSSVNIESLERCIGVTVSVTVTYQKEPIVGEVVAFDQYSQTLILRWENEKSGASKSYNYLMVAGAYIKSVTCQSIMSQSNKVDLPPVDWSVVDQREQAEIEKLKHAISLRRHPGVSKSDQELFNRLKRIYGSCEWGPDNEIRVEGAVVKPPYSVNDVSGPEKLVEFIKKVIKSTREQP